MRHLRTAAIVAVTALAAGVVMMVSGAFGASSTLSMNAGDTAHVTCGGPSLGVANQMATALDLNCAPNPTTTTTQPCTPAVLLGNTAVQATADGSNAPASEAFGYTATASGPASSASVYLTSTDGAQVGLYADSSSHPGALLDTGHVASNTAGWTTIPLPGGATVTSGTRYWLAIGANAGGNVTYRDHDGTGTNLDFSGTGFANPYSSNAQWNSNPVSAYVSSSCSGGGTTTTTVPQTTTTAPSTTTTVPQTTSTTASGGGGGITAAPTSPPVSWCETGVPQSPFGTAPAGAVVVPAGDDSQIVSNTWDISPNTTYWFAPGTHTGVGIQPQNNDVFMGAPGAVIDGGAVKYVGGPYTWAFVGPASGVTIEYLTVQNYPGGTDTLVVNHDGAPGWTIKDNLFQLNGGGAAGAGDNGIITDNCLTHNNQYGFQVFGTGATVTANDVADNNPNGYYDLPGSTVGCGCAGGDKFWGAHNVTVEGNYVHHNGGPGLWADTDNAGFQISGNYISNNWGIGVMYEISYNAQITYNTLIGNAVGQGQAQATPGFPDGAIYISESGNDSRVNSMNNSGPFLIANNVLTNNWGGVIAWENANRHCGDGSDGTACTLVDPATYTSTSCANNLSEKTPVDYYDNCRWKTQNLLVENNVETLDLSVLGSSCTYAHLCGLNGLFSDYGNAPYDACKPCVAVTFQQNNVFTNNKYIGPWQFYAWSQSNLSNPVKTWLQPVTDQCSTSSELSSGSCDSGFGQDTGSTFG